MDTKRDPKELMATIERIQAETKQFREVDCLTMNPIQALERAVFLDRQSTLANDELDRWLGSQMKPSAADEPKQ
jgi:hypothetical protein